MNHTSVFYQLIYYICKQEFFNWEIKDNTTDLDKNKDIEKEQVAPDFTDTEKQKEQKEQEEIEKVEGGEDEKKEIKVKISKLGKKNLLFESNDLTQSIVIPLKEIWDLKFEKETYTFFLKSKPENLHVLTKL
jgi:hypothetical protein